MSPPLRAEVTLQHVHLQNAIVRCPNARYDHQRHWTRDWSKRAKAPLATHDSLHKFWGPHCPRWCPYSGNGWVASPVNCSHLFTLLSPMVCKCLSNMLCFPPLLHPLSAMATSCSNTFLNIPLLFTCLLVFILLELQIPQACNSTLSNGGWQQVLKRRSCIPNPILLDKSTPLIFDQVGGSRFSKHAFALLRNMRCRRVARFLDSGRVRPREGTEICNFGAPSPLDFFFLSFGFLSFFSRFSM